MTALCARPGCGHAADDHWLYTGRCDAWECSCYTFVPQPAVETAPDPQPPDEDELVAQIEADYAAAVDHHLPCRQPEPDPWRMAGLGWWGETVGYPE